MEILNTYKPKFCSRCGEQFTPKWSEFDKYCSYECRMADLKEKNAEKQENSSQKSHKFRTKPTPKMSQIYAKNVKKDKPKTFMGRRNEVKILAQECSRLRDEKLPCLACGTMRARQWHGAHLFKAELYSGVILNEFNINKLCDNCNFMPDGNFEGHKWGFIERYGMTTFNALEKLAQETRYKKWMRSELDEKEQYFKDKIAQYKLKQ